MKNILFISNLESEEDVKKIADELASTRLNYTISLSSRSVSIEGGNDLVYLARSVLQEAGYLIK